MTELDDQQLLREFAKTNSETAFATLVERYVNLAYSTALRFTNNPHHAEEITQVVFIILARKAEKLSPNVVLSGWLYQTARLTAANFLKSERRRQFREQEVFMQSTLSEPNETSWNEIAPLLDEAMGKLGETDRNAVVLRFFENKTAAEVAAKLNLTEAASHKRVNRALEKLRKFFSKRGVSSTTAILAGTISTNSIQAAPIGLAKTISAVALTKGAVVSTSTLTLIKGALKIMAWTKMKTAAVAGVVLILAAGTTTVIVKNYGHHPQVKLQWTPAEKESFNAKNIALMNDAKQFTVFCFLFADDHKNRWPTNFAELETSFGGQSQFLHLSDSDWEFVSGGDKIYSFDNSSKTILFRASKTILFREKTPRPSPDGRFVKVYAFADGHVQLVSSPDDDFSASEKKFGFVTQPAKN